MHGMAGFARYDTTNYLPAEKRQIANQVEHLMTNKFVGVAQGAVHHAVTSEHDTAVERCTADQSHFSHRLLVFAESEGAGRGDLTLKLAIVQMNLETFETRFADAGS